MPLRLLLGALTIIIPPIAPIIRRGITSWPTLVSISLCLLQCILNLRARHQPLHSSYPPPPPTTFPYLRSFFIGRLPPNPDQAGYEISYPALWFGLFYSIMLEGRIGWDEIKELVFWAWDRAWVWWMGADEIELRKEITVLRGEEKEEGLRCGSEDLERRIYDRVVGIEGDMERARMEKEELVQESMVWEKRMRDEEERRSSGGGKRKRRRRRRGAVNEASG